MTRLGTKLTLTVTIFMAATVALLAPLRIAYERRHLIELYSLDGRLAAEAIAAASVSPIENFYFEGLRPLCERAATALAPVVHCAIYLKVGDVRLPPHRYLSTDPPSEPPSAMKPYWRAFTAPIEGQSERVGEVVIIFDWTPLNIRLRNLAIRAITVIAAVTAILIVVLRVLLGHVLLRPILALVHATRNVTSGNYSLLPESNHQDEIAELIHSFNVMTQAIATHQANLAYQATTDSLTQVANRHQFEQWLQAAWQQAEQEHTNLGLLLCDVDYFKRYNDTYGHVAGDQCLRQVATLMGNLDYAANVRVARYGGEEFIILVSDASWDSLAAIATLLQQRLHVVAIPHAASPYGYVTLSIGGHILTPPFEQAPEALIQAADQALYAAKAQGRNSYRASVQTPDVLVELRDETISPLA